MNVLFLSPTFPACNTGFAKQLMERDVRVLGVGDMGYDRFSPEQRSSLTEYYFVTSLEDYDSVYRAAAFFIHKYGRIDRIVSLNAYWQPLASALRQEYGVDGVRKATALKEGNCHVTYEALLDGAGQPVLEMSRAVFGEDGAYTLPVVGQTLRNAARNAFSAMGIRNDFVTVELRKVGRGYSVVNAYAAPAAFAPDIFNYVFAFDVYSAWAHLMTGGQVESAAPKQTVTMIRTMDGREYPGVSAEYFSELEHKILQESPASAALANVGGDTVYLLSANDENDAHGMLSAFTGKEILPFAVSKPIRPKMPTDTGQATGTARFKQTAGTVTTETVTEPPEAASRQVRRKPGPKPKTKAENRVSASPKKNGTANKKENKKSIPAPDLSQSATRKDKTTGRTGQRTGRKTAEPMATVNMTASDQPVDNPISLGTAEKDHTK